MYRHANAKPHSSQICKLLAVVCAIGVLALGGATFVRGATVPQNARPAASAQNSRASSSQSYASVVSAAAEGNGVPFAIADFDGDQRPDLARVQPVHGNSFQTQYWIQLQLTRAGGQLIGIVGPAGGLQLIASDVNGDHAIDLVLKTAWLNRPVAILLNDGHGRFRTEKPSAFPGAFRRATTNWLSNTQHLSGAASLTQSRSGLFVYAHLAHAPPQTPVARHSNLTVFPSNLLLSRFGRAPPVRS